MNVAVVGAGIAGLRTAQLLERLGVEVTVFEASGRLGGRLWTTKVGDQTFEAGGEWIDAEHARVLGLLAEFGLNPVPSDPRPRRFFFKGRFVEEPEVEIRGSGASLGQLLDQSASDDTERAYLEAVALSDEGTDSDQVDAGEWRRFNANYAAREGSQGMSAYRFPIETSELCRRIAGTLRGEVHLHTELVAVKDYFGAQLKFVGGTKETHDEVVLAVPPTCLNRVDLRGERPSDGIEMTPTAKVALLFDEKFWEKEDWGGSLMSDLPVQQFWPSGSALVCYVNGRAVESLAASGDPVRTALDAITIAAPRARMHFVEGRIVDWRREPFANGGFPFVPMGASRRSLPVRGPIRYAGDWTANWLGFIEGALESAERVVEEFKIEHSLS